MPRRAAIWPRKGTPWWYTTLGGKQIRLSQDRKEAEKLFHELMAKKAVDDELPPTDAAGPTFKKLADEYLVATEGEKGPQAFGQQVAALQDFCGSLKKRLRAADLRPHMVTAWLKGKTTWGKATQAGKRKTVKAVLNWAVAEGHLTENPLKRMAVGDTERRDRVLTEDEKGRIFTFVSPDFRDFLRAVDLTGARPFSEMAQVTAADVDFAAGTITLQRHKNRAKTGQPRTIFAVPELLAILEARAAVYPQGVLFRSRRGKPWYTGSSCKWFTEVEKKLGIKDAFAYAFRHTFITNALIRGVPVEVVAELVGNTPQIIYKHYAHVGKDRAAMKAAALKAVGVSART